jgi:hypothetical protein
MKKKGLFAGILAVTLIFGLGLTGCGDGAGGGGDRTLLEIKALPSFDGAFVASEAEATTLIDGAGLEIDAAIAAALALGGASPNIRLGVPPSAGSVNPPDFGSRAAAGSSGHYSYNGVSLDYSVKTSGNYPYASGTADVVERVTINGTYNGYKINGRYDVKLHHTVVPAGEIIKYNYDCVFVVSHSGSGKGMKIVQTGDLTMDDTVSPTTLDYNLHYAVYDNSNECRYNYDYNVSL